MDNGQLHIRIFHVWACIRFPAGTTGEGPYFCDCLVGHGKPPLKRLSAVMIVPWLVGMIKTELVGMEYGWTFNGVDI